MVRDTVGAETVVLDAGAEVCADANTAAKTRMAKDRFFTRVLDLGEIESFLIFFYGAGYRPECKGQEGLRGNSTLVTAALTCG